MGAGHGSLVVKTFQMIYKTKYKRLKKKKKHTLKQEDLDASSLLQQLSAF